MEALIVDTQYFGDCAYFSSLVKHTDMLIDQYERHRKGSFLNRCVIAGANGPIKLSVPLEKGREQKTPVKEIRISNQEKWQHEHWKSLLSCYNGSPWFVYYTDSMSYLYQKKFSFLLDWNIACMEWMMAKLGVTLNWNLTAAYQEEYTSTGEYVDFRSRSSLRKKQAITDLTFRYRQVFEEKTGFIPGMSIVDLLFCEGARKTLDMLKQLEAGT